MYGAPGAVETIWYAGTGIVGVSQYPHVGGAPGQDVNYQNEEGRGILRSPRPS
jgi:hypothetical protein